MSNDYRFSKSTGARVRRAVEQWENAQRNRTGQPLMRPLPQQVSDRIIMEGTVFAEFGPETSPIWFKPGGAGMTDQDAIKAANPFKLVGRVNDRIVVVKYFDRTGLADDVEWFALMTTPQANTIQLDSAFDTATGSWTKTRRTVYLNLPTQTDLGTATYVSGAVADVRYNGVSSGVSVTSEKSSIVYGEPCELTGSISPTSDNGFYPSGLVHFYSAAFAASGNVSDAEAKADAPLLPVGEWTIRGEYSGDEHFDGSSTGAGGATITVSKASVTVALSASKTEFTYGDSVQLSATVQAASPSAAAPTGAVEFYAGETKLGQITLALGQAVFNTTEIPAGNQALTAKLVNLDGNWNGATSDEVAVTVAKRTLTVTAANASRTYGFANPGFTATITGWINGDVAKGRVTGAAALTCTAVLTSSVGTYPITAAIGTLASDLYTFAFVAGTLTVNPATLTGEADNKSGTAYRPIPALTGVLSGLRNGDGITLALSTYGDQNSPPGSYAILVDFADASPSKLSNYTQTKRNGTLTLQ